MKSNSDSESDSDAEGICLARSWHIGTGPAAPTRRNTMLGLAGLALTCCGTRRDNPPVAIEFTRIPQADEGGRDKHDIIEGRVTGPSAQHQIVLYAKSRVWWG